MPSSPISPESEASKYLLARGIDLDFAADHGAVWTEDEDEIRERLGLEPVDDDDSGWTGEKGLNAAENKRESRRTSRAQNKFFDKELLSFPLCNGNGYLSKPFPVADGDKSKGFRVTLHCREPIFIPEKTWEARRDSSIPLFVTEGPIRALAIEQAGGLAIGLNGTYANAKVRRGKPRELHPVLREKFELFGRRVYLAFDADQWGKKGVRRSVLRNYLMLTTANHFARRGVWQNYLAEMVFARC